MTSQRKEIGLFPPPLNAKNLSPLRYPGGKNSIYRILAAIVDQNKPIQTYIEPFVGGSGAALKLVYFGFVDQLILNDLDKGVYCFWKSVLEHPNEFIRRLMTVSVNLREWKKQRRIYLSASSRTWSYRDIGFATFFLNRTNRSGILTGGPIGGVKQSSKWKIDARFNREDLIQRIIRINAFRHRIKLYNMDALQFLKVVPRRLNLSPSSTIAYLDPPYYSKGEMLYQKFFDEADHRRLRSFLGKEFGYKWILSYDDAPEIRALYGSSRKNGIQLNHFAHKAKIGRELIIMSDDCKPPRSLGNLLKNYGTKG